MYKITSLNAETEDNHELRSTDVTIKFIDKTVTDDITTSNYDFYFQ